MSAAQHRPWSRVPDRALDQWRHLPVHARDLDHASGAIAAEASIDREFGASDRFGDTCEEFA